MTTPDADAVAALAEAMRVADPDFRTAAALILANLPAGWTLARREEHDGEPRVDLRQHLAAIEAAAAKRERERLADAIGEGAWDDEVFRPAVERAVAKAGEFALARHVRETGCEGLREALAETITAVGIVRLRQGRIAQSPLDDRYSVLRELQASWDAYDEMAAKRDAALASPATEEAPR